MPASSVPSECSFIFGASEDREEFVTNKLREYNRSFISKLLPITTQPAASLEIYSLDEGGSVVGGLIGRTNEIPEWLEISILWVSEEKRGQGIGRTLMNLAEEEAKSRGCRFARLATSDYQAPEFYHRIGYRQYGELENCPRGETVHYFCRELV